MYGDKIKELRKNLKLSQKELADQCGLSISYIQQIESGKKNNPSLEALTSIADVLQVNIYSLLDKDMEEYYEQIHLNNCLDWLKPILLPSNDILSDEESALHGYTVNILEALQSAYKRDAIREEFYNDVAQFLTYLSYRYGFDPFENKPINKPE
ncbi:MAG: helix-turn-helix domain-containing protein [Cellulosilyticaceae bacterium]